MAIPVAIGVAVPANGVATVTPAPQTVAQVSSPPTAVPMGLPVPDPMEGPMAPAPLGGEVCTESCTTLQPPMENTMAAPCVEQMARESVAPVPKPMRRQQLELTLASHPGQAVVNDGTCFLPWYPCIPCLFCVSTGELALGHEHNAIRAHWDPSPNGGNLKYFDGAGCAPMRFHVTWGTYAAEREIGGFSCCMPAFPDAESFILYSDGTIRARPKRNLAIGIRRDNSTKLCLVDAGSPRRLVFKNVLEGALS